MDQKMFSERLRQVLVLMLIIVIAVLLIWQLKSFLPGLLGGLTLYILSRSLYFKLIFKRKWKKGLTAVGFILAYLIIIALPVYLCVSLISPKVNDLMNHQDKIISTVQSVAAKIQDKTGIRLLSPESVKNLSQRLSALIPTLLNSTATILANLLMMFFLLYYLLVNGRTAEKYLNNIIPLKPANINVLASETKMMIKANALGIPLICIIQGAFAALGYWIFGVEDWALWGFVTGVFAFFPLVGTMIIWVPLAAYLFTQGQNWQAIALTVYSVVVTGNVDYVARLGLMKRMGDVHPLITVLGVIVGLGMFGFIGLIFGPLMISYFLILVKIYINEFTEDPALPVDPNPPGIRKDEK